FEKVLNGFARSDTVKSGMVHRRQLPVSVAERLVHLVSVKLQEQLVARHALPVDLATDLILQSRERATLGLLSPAAETVDVQALVAQLHAHRRLTPSIVLRALCMGDLEFFERGVATLAGLPFGAARTLIHDQGALGLPAVIDRAGLPESLLPVVRAAIDVAGETQYDGGENDRERFRARMLERV